MAFTIPSFRLPRFIRDIGVRLPQWPHSLALVSGLNLALKLGWLPADELEILTGKVIEVSVEDTGGCAAFSYTGQGFRPVFSTPDALPDLRFHATLSAYLKLLSRQEDPDTLFFNRELELTGDTELGLFVKNMLDALEWPPSAFSDLRNKFASRLHLPGLSR